MIGNETFCGLKEGAACAADIDTALEFGPKHRMDHFEPMGVVGPNARVSILEYLHRTPGEKYLPCPLLVQYVDAGWLGRKARRGVYKYPRASEKAQS
jgi:3-hydroxybutyryl-CoA dehydrogenase